MTIVVGVLAGGFVVVVARRRNFAARRRATSARFRAAAARFAAADRWSIAAVLGPELLVSQALRIVINAMNATAPAAARPRDISDVYRRPGLPTTLREARVVHVYFRGTAFHEVHAGRT